LPAFFRERACAASFPPPPESCASATIASSSSRTVTVSASTSTTTPLFGWMRSLLPKSGTSAMPMIRTSASAAMESLASFVSRSAPARARSAPVRGEPSQRVPPAAAI
jgi:hypothetical protein